MEFENKKFFINSTLAVATLALSYFFWQSPVLLVVFLGVTSILMVWNEGDRVALYVFGVGFILGPLAEALAIQAGAWTYADPHFLGFSVWLPFLWGNTGLFFRRLNLFVGYLFRN